MMTGQNPDDISDTTDLHNNKDDTSSITNNTGSTTTSKAQKLAFPRYTHNRYGEMGVVLQTPFIHLTQYGIPSLGEYYADDAARDFIKVPFDPNVKESMVLMNKLEQLDELVDKKMKNDILGKSAKSFIYQPIVRLPQEKFDDDDDDKPSNKEQKERFK